MNLVKARLVGGDGALHAEFGKQRLRVPESITGERPALPRYAGREIVLGIRPEDLEDASVANGAPADQRMTVETDIREDMGSEVFVHFSVEAEPVRTEEVVAALEEEAVDAIEERARRRGVPFIARVDRVTRAREGEPLELVVDTKHLHFFDSETGLGIYSG